MIDCNNLMLGDYVRVISTGEIVRITEVGSTCLACGTKVLDYSEIEPIPLSGEFFKKNGIVGDEGYAILDLDDVSFLEYYYYEKRLRKIWTGVDEWENHSIVRDITFQCNCCYVHELQHALKMCNANIKIEL